MVFIWFSMIISRSSENNLNMYTHTHTHTHTLTESLLYTLHWHNIVNQLYFNLKKNMKKRKENVCWVSKYLGNKPKMSLGHLSLSSTSCEHITVFWHLPEKLTTASEHAEEETKEKVLFESGNLGSMCGFRLDLPFLSLEGARPYVYMLQRLLCFTCGICSKWALFILIVLQIKLTHPGYSSKTYSFEIPSAILPFLSPGALARLPVFSKSPFLYLQNRIAC